MSEDRKDDVDDAIAESILNDWKRRNPLPIDDVPARLSLKWWMGWNERINEIYADDECQKQLYAVIGELETGDGPIDFDLSTIAVFHGISFSDLEEKSLLEVAKLKAKLEKKPALQQIIVDSREKRWLWIFPVQRLINPNSVQLERRKAGRPPEKARDKIMKSTMKSPLDFDNKEKVELLFAAFDSHNERQESEKGRISIPSRTVVNRKRKRRYEERTGSFQNLLIAGNEEEYRLVVQALRRRFSPGKDSE